jgi:peptide/nickel transport system ATP-binding protein
MLLEVQCLKVNYRTEQGVFAALSGVNLSVGERENVAIVGESGSGKSTLGFSIVKLLPVNGSYAGGDIRIAGESILAMNEREVMSMRGRMVFMVFQDPLNSLNPVKKVGDQITEALRIKSRREGRTYHQDRSQVIDVFKSVRIPDPDAIFQRYPHELSGGQIQRVIIAMGLLLRPKLLIADEPTSAVDVTLQAQILRLLNELKEEYGLSVIFITHDISVAYNVADRIAVMYAGNIVEIGPAEKVIKSPMHPYTQGLVSCIPTGRKNQGPLKTVPGAVPTLLHPPTGCRYHPRCPYAMDICSKVEPELSTVENSSVACWLYTKAEAKSTGEGDYRT